MTFAQWRTLVVAVYQGGTTTHAFQMRICADGARSITVRDVESDLVLSKSYQNSHMAGLVKGAGTPITDDIAAVIAEVRGLMPLDADTPAISAIVDNAITTAYDGINTLAIKFDALLIQVMIDLQRHVPFYQVRQETVYLDGESGVTHDGFIDRVALPEFARIQQVWYGHYYAALAAGAYEAGDRLTSNGRVYQVVDGGTITGDEIGDGLTSTNGENETLGNLIFRYREGEREFPVRNITWGQRNVLRAGNTSVGPMYAFPPESDELWLYPALDAVHQFRLEWVGVAEVFADEDDVLFDQTAAEAAAHYIKAKIYESELDDSRTAATSFALYQAAVRKAVVDNEARATGSPTVVAPYDWRGRCWRGCLSNSNCSPGGTGSLINDYFLLTNATGTTTLIARTANNMTVQVNFTGSASTRTIGLRTTSYKRGDRVTIVATLPGVAGIVLDFRNASAAGAQLLPGETFPDSVYTSDIYVLSATFNFVFNGTAWEYDESSIPS